MRTEWIRDNTTLNDQLVGQDRRWNALLAKRRRASVIGTGAQEIMVRTGEENPAKIVMHTRVREETGTEIEIEMEAEAEIEETGAETEIERTEGVEITEKENEGMLLFTIIYSFQFAYTRLCVHLCCLLCLSSPSP